MRKHGTLPFAALRVKQNAPVNSMIERSCARVNEASETLRRFAGGACFAKIRATRDALEAGTELKCRSTERCAPITRR